MRKRRNIQKLLTASVVTFVIAFNLLAILPLTTTSAKTNEMVNLALGKEVYTSSNETASFTGDKVVDGVVDRPTEGNKAGLSRWASNVGNNGKNQWLVVDLGSITNFNEVVIEWERNNIETYSIEISNDNTNWSSIYSSNSISALRDKIALGKDNAARYIRIFVSSFDPSYWDNISIYEVEVYKNEEGLNLDDGTGENLALNKRAVASSLEVSDGRFTADKITDGDVSSNSSRWSSGSLNNGITPQWIYVDLEEVKTFDKVKLYWQNANSNIYQIQTSNDGEEWTSVYRTEEGKAGAKLISFNEKLNARYIRVYCEKNNPAVWTSVSLFELEVYNGKLPQSLEEVVNGIKVNINEDDTKLSMPDVPSGYEISFIGADYKQIISDDMTIYKPLVDTKVILDFKVKQGDKEKVTNGVEAIVPGKYSGGLGNNPKPTVIPELREWVGNTGSFTLTESSKIVVSPSASEKIFETAQTFVKDFEDVVGRKIEVVVSDDRKTGDFYLTLGNTYPEIGEEGYFINVGDKVEVEANDVTGVYYAAISLLQILKQSGDTIPMGLIRDYPRYEVRGFMLDVARKPVSLDFLEELVKNMSWYKMNDFQVHLNDNYIWLEEHENPFEAYSGFRLESENHPGLASEDLHYTKEEFGNFIDESGKYGVNIVPEIDSPSHALAFTKVYPELASGTEGRKADHLDILNPETYKLIESIFDEYMDGENPTFRDSVVHIGTDEYFGHVEEFRSYTDYFLKYIKSKGRTPRLWGGLTWLPGETQVITEGVQINIWSKDWADPSDMHELGFDLINTEDSQLYIVPSAGYYYDYLNIENLYNNWVPNKFANGDIISAGDPQMIGGMFALWNDMIDKKANGIVEYDLFDRIFPAVQTLSEKLWGRAEDKTFQEFKEVAKEVGIAPNTNPRFNVESKTETVINYTLNEELNGLKDTSGNEYNIVGTNNVESVKGKNGKAIKLKGGESFIQSPIDNIGPNYSVSVKVKRDLNSGSEEQILFESEKGAFKAVQKETGKVGFSREFYDFSFNYELPLDTWVDLTIVGMQNKTQLYVNGEYVDEISKAGTAGKYHGTFVFPLEVIGSKTNSFKGLVDDIVVSNTKVVTDKTIIPQENMTATATSEQAVSGSEGPASFVIDGNENTTWHTKWSPNKDELPQSITINLGGEYNINKLSYLPRANGSNGNITAYDILISRDGVNFEKVSEGNWSNNNSLKKAEFNEIKASYIRLTAKEGVGGFASAAEINIHKVIEDEEENIIVSKPQGLKASNILNDSVSLSWEAPKETTGLMKYVIYKDGKELTSVSKDLTKWTVNDLKENTIYGFKITARYSNGEESKPISINLRTSK